ncbi:MAG: hypothetical protein M3N57_13250, partial [Actinomycetota bacterium]|nr:hypothetical protein [Actinomycetota bacterium]
RPRPGPDLPPARIQGDHPDGGDARARWLQRADEAVQSLQLAALAGDATIGDPEVVEDPRAGTEMLVDRLPSWLEGLEWRDALTTIASLDLDLEATAGRSATAQSRAD